MRVSAIVVVLILLICMAQIIPLRTMAEAKHFWPIFAFGMMGAWYKDVYESFAVTFKLPKFIQTVNKHSFGLYITHQFVINFFIARLAAVNKYPLLTLGLMFVLTTITSLAICITYEYSKNCILRKVCVNE